VVNGNSGLISAVYFRAAHVHSWGILQEVLPKKKGESSSTALMAPSSSDTAAVEDSEGERTQRKVWRQPLNIARCDLKKSELEVELQALEPPAASDIAAKLCRKGRERSLHVP